MLRLLWRRRRERRRKIQGRRGLDRHLRRLRGRRPGALGLRVALSLIIVGFLPVALLLPIS